MRPHRRVLHGATLQFSPVGGNLGDANGSVGMKLARLPESEPAGFPPPPPLVGFRLLPPTESLVLIRLSHKKSSGSADRMDEGGSWGCLSIRNVPVPVAALARVY